VLGGGGVGGGGDGGIQVFCKFVLIHLDLNIKSCVLGNF